MAIKFDAKRYVTDILKTVDDCLVSLCKLRRTMDEHTKIKVDNKIEEFKMLDKMAQKFAQYDDLEQIGQCHYLMNEIVKELEPIQDEVFMHYPEFRDIFTTFLKGYIRD